MKCGCDCSYSACGLALECIFDFADSVNERAKKTLFDLFIEKIAWNENYAQWCYDALLAEDEQEK